MRPSLWFVMPAYRRVEITRVCLRQLARTCAALTENGVDASAVVIAADENLDTAAQLGFGTVERANRPLGRKWNDGYELAGHAGVDYVCALGSDDWVDPALFLDELPSDVEIRSSRLSAVVSENGRSLATLRIPYDGGDGVRVLPTALLRPLRYRPAEEDRDRAIDTSVMRRLQTVRWPLRIRYHDVHPLQIVDWKSSREQLNGFEPCLKYRTGDLLDPWQELRAYYPTEALAEMAGVYGVRQAVAA